MFATYASNPSTNKEESTAIIGILCLNQPYLCSFGLRGMQSQKNQQRALLRFLFSEAIPQETGALEKVKFQTKRAKYLKDEPIDKIVLN
jgi:hypothetical protein